MEGSAHIGYLDSTGKSRIREDLDQAARLRSSRDMLKTANVLSRQLHVAIVGAGFAGLRCADVLLEHGAKVTIFEARDRVGGRVAQGNLAGHTVDLSVCTDISL